MPTRGAVDPVAMRAAVLAVVAWLDGGAEPSRAEVAAAVRLSARTLAQIAPGNSVEVRVPPWVAVQCVEGPRHTRGTPPNVVETDARTWMELVTGRITTSDAAGAGRLSASGSRAREIDHWLPLLTA